MQIRVPQRGDKRDLHETVTRNAKEEFTRHRLRRASDHNSRSRALTELQDLLQLPEAPLRIECYDMAHIQGTDYVGSMVVLEDGLPNKREYRRFKVKTVEGNDDYAAMEEVLTRRLTAYLNERDHPSTSAATVPASSPTRRSCCSSTAARVSSPWPSEWSSRSASTTRSRSRRWPSASKRSTCPGSSQPVNVPRGGEALFMLQRIRDEAHRFANTFHRELRGKRMTKSSLDDIPGLGDNRKKRLARELGGVNAVKKASLETLKSLTWLPDAVAETIYAKFHPSRTTGTASASADARRPRRRLAARDIVDRPDRRRDVRSHSTTRSVEAHLAEGSGENRSFQRDERPQAVRSSNESCGWAPSTILSNVRPTRSRIRSCHSCATSPGSRISRRRLPFIRGGSDRGRNRASRALGAPRPARMAVISMARPRVGFDELLVGHRSTATCGHGSSAALGFDLGAVRIHADSRLAPEVGAEAFTYGSHVHFAPGAFRPESSGGQRLLGHELAHVVQQGAVQRMPRLQRKFGRSLAKPTLLALLEAVPQRRQIKNHIPSTGLGRFDAEYLHDQNKMVITVKPYFEFVQTVAGGVTTPGGWVKTDEDDFALKFKQQTEAAWSGKYSFTCTKAGYTELRADVEIKVERELDASKAHFHHKIQKNKGMVTGIGREQNDDPTKLNVGNFAEQDAPVRPHDSATTCAGIASHDAERLTDLLEVFHVNPIRFTGGSRNQIDAASRTNIDNFVAAALRTERPGSVPVPLVVFGKRNKREVLERGNAAQDRANVVKAYVDGKGIRSRRARRSSSTTSCPRRRRSTRARRARSPRTRKKVKLDDLKGRQNNQRGQSSV